MNSGLNPADPTLVAAFRTALLHQGAIALIVLALVWLLWGTARTWRMSTPAAQQEQSTAPAVREAPGRRLLRVGFGLIWILDGILQAQPKMAGGLAAQVIQPTAASSPAWVQHVVNWGGTIWSYHPIQSGAAAVWIQVGLGGWLLVAAHGRWSRLAGLAAVAWGLVVWVFGESFGGIFAPGLSWLTGAPGAVLLYVLAGALVALPEDAWRSPRLGRLLLAGLGLFYLGMAVLQAWPGRGYWQGVSGGKPGTLAAMVQNMASTPQPHVLSALVAGFGSFAASNGFAVNLVVVIVLAATGVIFLTGRRRLVRYAVWGNVVFGLGGDRVQVLGLTQTVPANPGGGNAALVNAALLQAGTSLLAAWSDGSRWTVSAPVAAGQVSAAGFGPGGSAWVLLGGGRAQAIAGPGGSWRAQPWRTLPGVPPGTATLAPGAGGYEALAASGSRLAVWQLSGAGWRQIQVMNVPITYGSSG